MLLQKGITEPVKAVNITSYKIETESTYSVGVSILLVSTTSTDRNPYLSVTIAMQIFLTNRESGTSHPIYLSF